jgi:hypothetical protein
MAGDWADEANRITVHRYESPRGESYDVGLAACGYEERSSHLISQSEFECGRLLALDYGADSGSSYRKNRQRFDLYSPVFFQTEHEFRLSLDSALQAVVEGRGPSASNRPIRIAVDVSSLDRRWLAVIVHVLGRERSEELFINFLYAEGSYAEELVGSEGTVVVNRALERFEGWGAGTEKPLLALLGLGFEAQLAVAAIETLEPSQTLLLSPRGKDTRFDARVSELNSSLLNSNVQGVREYKVANPYRTFLTLEAVIVSNRDSHRLVLIPIGPKPFAVAALLAAMMFGDEVAVWRVSADAARHRQDRRAAGPIIGITCHVAGRS